MQKIFKDDVKIKKYAQIQKELCDLKPIASDEDIEKIIKLIPPEYLNQKDELMLICQMFAYIARCQPTPKKGNSFKLFQRILTPLKTYLKDESTFFWNIFAGLFYFKLWMHEQGLISIETIIRVSQDGNNSIAEYFYPEIYEERPEIFEKETKYQLNFTPTPESIEKYKELRRKHFKWLVTSGDFHDPSYLEIETNRLRLSIKRDDFDTFQNILSSSNLPVDSKIRESVIENFYFSANEVSLIEYVSSYNSINIFKFLIMQNATLSKDAIFDAILSRNYEIIHIVESKIPDVFKEMALSISIKNWSNDMIEYALDNYDYEFFFESDVKDDKTQIIIGLILDTFIASNFIFFESTILPFLRQNPNFLLKNINSIFVCSVSNYSCYFATELLKLPGIDFNAFVDIKVLENISFIGRAIQIENIKAIEIAMKYPNIDINKPCMKSYPPFLLACKYNTDVKILEMMSKYKGFDENSVDSDGDNDNALSIASFNGNFYALQFIKNNFFDSISINKESISFDIFCCIKHNNFLTLELLVKFFLTKFKTPDDLVKHFKIEFLLDPSFDEEYVEQLKKTLKKLDLK
ncbi:hypothetical protein M9Y10_030452 [Tritrichomonas musculus]|uniref:DUF3447 domain-containing protein n=2 Tax=Tritrichomonas musculus TaxID=1915356 RepID=A0ABR2H453_9EUKA